MPSPHFMKTTKFRETAQPYMAKCHPSLTVVSAHNGNVTNYKEIRERMGKAHIFESEKIELIDSEVIPHCFEELLKKKADVDKVLDTIFSTLEGPNALSLLRIEKERASLHFIHKGKTRGLTIWTNTQDEVIFCSRKEPLIEVFGEILAQGKFTEKVTIPYNEDVSLKLSFSLDFK